MAITGCPSKIKCDIRRVGSTRRVFDSDIIFAYFKNNYMIFSLSHVCVVYGAAGRVYVTSHASTPDMKEYYMYALSGPGQCCVLHDK